MAVGTMYATLSPLIQASLSPVFLLSAVGTTLLIIDTRLNRIVDRCRTLEAMLVATARRDLRTENELQFYLQRAGRVRWAAFFCTFAALILAIVVVTLFIDAQTQMKLAHVVEVLFTAAVLFLVIGLVLYMQDVFQVDRALDFTRSRLADIRAVPIPQVDADVSATTKT